MYTDPDGEWIQYVIGAVMGGISGWQIGDAIGASGWKMAGCIFFGAAIGAATAGVGTYVSTAVAQSTSFGTIGSGLIGATVGGAASGAVSGLGNGLLISGMTNNWNLNTIWKSTWTSSLSGLVGGGIGSYIGGTLGAISGGAIAGGLHSGLNEGEIDDIILAAVVGGAISGAAYELQMLYGYTQYNNGEKPLGKLTYGGFRKISVATQRAFARNQEASGVIDNDGNVGKIKYGTKTSTELPLNLQANERAGFHTHQWTNYVQEYHSYPEDYLRYTNYVIGWKNIYTYDISKIAGMIFTDPVQLLQTHNGTLNISPYFLYYY